MSLKSKYFDDILIKSNKKKQIKKIKNPCSYKGCEKEGLYMAPVRGVANKDGYVYFCLEHVREYNKNFNFFDNLSDEEKDKFLHTMSYACESKVVSNLSLGSTRASADFAAVRSGSAAYQRRVGNKYKIYGVENKEGFKRKLTLMETEAFATLSLEISATTKQITAQYKRLLKMHHPDVNDGDRSNEDKLNNILKAYKILKKGNLC